MFNVIGGMIIYKEHYFKRMDRKIPTPCALSFVILILLVIMCSFLFVLPAFSGIKVNMPKVKGDIIELYNDKQYATIYLYHDRLLINHEVVPIEDMDKYLSAKYSSKHDLQIFIRADVDVSYSKIAEMLQSLYYYGYNNITLVGKKDFNN